MVLIEDSIVFTMLSAFYETSGPLNFGSLVKGVFFLLSPGDNQ